MKNRNMWKRLAALAVGMTLLFSQTAVYAEEEAAAVQEENAAAEMARSESDVLTISSARELKEFAQKVNGGNSYAGKLIRLTQDIQFDGVTANNFTPISYDYEKGFEGTFDGSGYTISGINLTGASYSFAGLFGVIRTGGIVKNVTIKDSQLITRNRTGGIAGYNEGIIDNCHNKNTIIEKAATSGGIAGENKGTILNCSSSGVLSGNFFYAGGIAGANSGAIYNSCNEGNIIASIEDASTFKSNAKHGVSGIGGITGGGFDCIVENCYNTGKIITEQEIPYGGIVSFVSNSTNYTSAVVANSFCSEESAPVKICFVINSGVEKNNEALPETEMRTESFAAQLNANRGSHTDWLKWELRPEESPYPLLEARILKDNQEFKYTKSYTKAYGSKAFTLDHTLITGNGTLTYASSDKNVADVSKNGKVTIKGIGIAVITISASETTNYNASSVKVTIKVNPAAQTVKSVKVVKGRKLAVKWARDAKATGYQIQYSTDKAFKKGGKSVPVNKNTTTSKTITKLKKGSRYYVRVRSFKNVKVGGKTQTLYGKWSKASRSGSVKK